MSDSACLAVGQSAHSNVVHKFRSQLFGFQAVIGYTDPLFIYNLQQVVAKSIVVWILVVGYTDRVPYFSYSVKSPFSLILQIW